MIKKYFVKLQPRDVLFLKLVSQFGYLTSEHVEKWIFKTSNKSTRKRLLMLERAHFINFVTRRERSGTRKVYIPNQKELVGILDEELLPRCSKAVTMKPWFRSLTGHEDLVRNWAIRLQLLFPDALVDLDFMSSKSENESLNETGESSGLTPDIVLKLSTGAEIAFEIELTHKNQSRYFRKFFEILSTPNRPSVYLVNSLNVRNLVLKNLELVRQDMSSKGQFEYSELEVVSFEELTSDEKLIDLVTRHSAICHRHSVYGKSDPQLKNGNLIFG